MGSGTPIVETMGRASCRHCGALLQHTFADLGMSPLANSYLRANQLGRMERFYPLRAYVCDQCFLVQLEQFETPQEIFGEYAYFSSYSDTALAAAKHYAAQMMERFQLSASHHVVELASNDGYLLQYFLERGVRVLGIEPAANVAEVARAKGIPTIVKFFGTETAGYLLEEGPKADLLIGNNVLAHVPDLNDFIAGMQRLLAPSGVITMEFPHLMKLMEFNQFDTIYHEHFSYFSLGTVSRVFARHGLTIFDVDEIPAHGGSLRIYARQTAAASHGVSPRVTDLLNREDCFGLGKLDTYLRFGEQVRETKRNLLDFLIQVKRTGKSIAAYGAPAKGNTLLNYCGIRTDFIEYTVDRSPYKQGHFLPGTHIPIYDPSRIDQTKPDYVLVLAWNLRQEIMQQMAAIRNWGARFVVPIPHVEVLS